MKTVVKMICGSKLFGTDTPASDTDYKGIFIPSGKDILLNNVPKTSICNSTQGGDVDDHEMFTLLGFFKLVGQGQTVNMEMLFTPDEFIIERTPLWDEIVSNRDKLLHKKMTAFVGYCKSQSEKYSIKYDRIELLSKLVVELNTEYKMWKDGNVDLVELREQKPMPRLGDIIDALKVSHKYDESNLTFDVEIKQENKDLDYNGSHFMEVCNMKCQYSSKIDKVMDMLQEKLDGYGKRAKSLKSNADWKALSHAVRVGLECIELLKHSRITLPLEQAQMVKDIKMGKSTYDEVISLIDKNLSEIRELEVNTKLPDTFDKKWVDSLILREYTKAINEEI